MLTLTVTVCTAQEQFQVKFWKLRQAEYSPYLLQCSPLRVRRTPDAGSSLKVWLNQQPCMRVTYSDIASNTRHAPSPERVDTAEVSGHQCRC